MLDSRLANKRQTRLRIGPGLLVVIVTCLAMHADPARASTTTGQPTLLSDDPESYYRYLTWAKNRIGAKGIAVVGCGVGMVVSGGLALAPCLSFAGAFSTIAIIFLPVSAEGAEIPDAGNRVASGKGFASTFAGVATNGSDAVSYTGARHGSSVAGSYIGGDVSGSFAGTINRSGQVTGGYRQGDESGTFSGRATRSLDRVFGNSRCIRNCDD